MPTQPTRKRIEFSNRQKAEIFVRDRATCAFSGKSLWLLDYGASPAFDIDWVDHIKPAMRGGDASIENGICASSFFNAKKRDNSRDNQYFFVAGKPTEQYFLVFEELPERTAQNLRRFAVLEPSDWYFNRALFHLLLAVESQYDKERGKSYLRGVDYYAKSAVKMLKEWRRIAAKPSANAFQERGLVTPPLSKDQELMLSLADAQTTEDVARLANALCPYYQASDHAIRELVAVEGKDDAERFLQHINTEPFLSPRMKGIAKLNAVRLYHA